MYQPLSRSGANDPATATSVAERPAVLGKVLGLLGFAFLFTAGGAVIGANLGSGAFVISAIGSFATLIGLMFAREKSPLNLVLLYSFAVFEGLLLGLVLEEYVASGSAAVVLDAAATTAVVTLAAGAYGFTTQRDLRGLGGVLTVGLIAVIVASLIGIFVQLAALVFTGFLVYDLNRVANSSGATEGQVILLTVSVYLDIWNLFLALLRLFEANSRSD